MAGGGQKTAAALGKPTQSSLRESAPDILFSGSFRFKASRHPLGSVPSTMSDAGCGGYVDTGFNCDNVTAVDVYPAAVEDFLTRVMLAMVSGAIIGFEREYRLHVNRRCSRPNRQGEIFWLRPLRWNRKVINPTAGLRTHMLVAVGSCLFTLESQSGFVTDLPLSVAGLPDGTRVAAQIVSGVGFLGGGAILKSEDRLRGLTTAASIWITAALGMASGSVGSTPMHFPIIVALIVVSILQLLGLFEVGTHRRCNAGADRTLSLTMTMRVLPDFVHAQQSPPETTATATGPGAGGGAVGGGGAAADGAPAAPCEPGVTTDAAAVAGETTVVDVESRSARGVELKRAAAAKVCRFGCVHVCPRVEVVCLVSVCVCV
jgi:uncharacterized membrane protein YhiD involved in acid resistance